MGALRLCHVALVGCGVPYISLGCFVVIYDHGHQLGSCCAAAGQLYWLAGALRGVSWSLIKVPVLTVSNYR
jgi:hypothetical protein